MKYTENYHLPQWVKTDRIMMDDFNQMCADIEEGLTRTEQTANTAKSVADGAANEAAKLPYVIGSYVGTGQDMTITLGFRPSFLIISGLIESGGSTTNQFYVCAAITGGNLPNRVVITDTGFFMPDGVTGANIYPHLTISGKRYDYIAFR